MKKQAALFLFLLALGFYSASAHALSFSLMGMGDSAQPTATQSVSGQTNYGEALFLNQHLAGRFTASLGVMNFTRSWTDSGNTYSGGILMTPLTLNFHFARYFALGVGGYYSQAQGNLNETGTTNNSNLQYGSYGIQSYDYGYVGRLDIRIPLAHWVALQLTGMYTTSALNLVTGGSNNFQNTDFIYMAGFSIPLGGGEEAREER